jgi:hypothetical protein
VSAAINTEQLMVKLKLSPARARHAISRLKRGVVPREGLALLTVPPKDLVGRVRNDMSAVKEGHSRRLFICGERGAGKTHMLEYMALLAKEENLAASMVTLETQANISFNKPEQLWTAVRLGFRNVTVSDVRRYHSYSHADLFSDICFRVPQKCRAAGQHGAVLLFDEVVNTLYTRNVKYRFKAYDALYSLIYNETPGVYIVLSVTKEFFNRVIWDQYKGDGTPYGQHKLQSAWAQRPPTVHSLASLNASEMRRLAQNVIKLYSIGFPTINYGIVDPSRVEHLCDKAVAKPGGQSWLIQQFISDLEVIEQNNGNY